MREIGIYLPSSAAENVLEAIEMSPNTLAKLGCNEDASMDVLKRICTYLQCDIGDIMEMIPEDENGH